MAIAIEIRGLKKRCETLSLYDDFSFDIEEGKTTAFYGPSGCGKTTLLRMIAGLEEPDAGTIRRNGEREEGGGSPRRQGIAFVFQEDRLLPWLTVKENLLLPLEETNAAEKKPSAGWKGELAEALEEMLSLVELQGFEDYFPQQLSGGMRRRAAIARAMLYCESTAEKGGLLIMDEPFKGLDQELKERVLERIYGRFRERRPTALLVTHDRKDAQYLCDTIWELSGRPLKARLVFGESSGKGRS